MKGATMEIVIESNETDLVPLRQMVVADVFTPGGGDPVIDRIRKAVSSLDLDVSTPEGRALIKSTAYKIARAKTSIDDAGKSYVDGLKELPKIVDTERRRIREALDALKDEVRGPLTEFENREAERVRRFEAMIEQITACGTYLPSTSAEIESRIDQARGIHTDVDFQEFASRAAKARETVILDLVAKAAAVKQAEIAAAELERAQADQAERDRIAREEQIRIEAEARVRREEEAKAQAESERQTAELQRVEEEKRTAVARADREKLVAEERAAATARQAEADRIAAEKQREEAAATARREQELAVAEERARIEREQQAKVEAEAARERDKAHKTKINREILAALIAAGLDEATAKIAGTAIIQKKVPHVEIRY